MNPADVLGFLGPSGTHCEAAANRYLQGTGKKQAFRSIQEIILAAEKGLIARGIVPLENSLEGTVNVSVDLLAKTTRLQIQAELVLPVEHGLLGLPGVKLTQVQSVVSHPQALAQCQRFLNRHLPGAKIIPANSTAEAAQIVAQQGTSKAKAPNKSKGGHGAAIASPRAATLYGLQVLASSISDVLTNETRFIVVGREEALPTGHDKTSLVLGLPHQPGSLLSALSVFAAAGINLTRIESRPSKRALGEYWFFVDVEGHRRESQVEGALKNLTKYTLWQKILGAYPVNSDRTQVFLPY